jgi:hypothetical protein
VTPDEAVGSGVLSCFGFLFLRGVVEMEMKMAWVVCWLRIPMYTTHTQDYASIPGIKETVGNPMWQPSGAD